ncbi:MAG TPA: hypothetical protein DCP69_03360 [Candidatus Omnitrophica bacterium]|nr:hypothetical protein [Candidatus Omnitrophota bacterium]
MQEGRIMQAPQTYRKDEMIKIAAIARRWGVSRQHVYNLIDAGKLTAFRFGGSRGMWVPLPIVKQFEAGAVVDPNK